MHESMSALRNAAKHYKAEGGLTHDELFAAVVKVLVDWDEVGLVVSREWLSTAGGRYLDAADCVRLGEALEHSSFPDVVSTVVGAMWDSEFEDGEEEWAHPRAKEDARNKALSKGLED